MTGLQLLEDKIGEFQAHLNDAWRSLSGAPLTPFERRELRNEMKRCGAELQRCLELVRAETQPISPAHRRKRSHARQGG